ncbi:GAF and ANTAR domain-containing protein [Actinopolymorpha alba]|uniref:GAF and ANTAR domain-containing protein n=1 Tax=Actinopolymorpha alba TaxID=533267 RepID=UPI0003605839|nr:GAF and ANTAR domain-containing protein [Actinopolymorpha alba]
MSRDERLTKAIVELADTLTTPFDVADFLRTFAHHCVDILGAAGASVLMADDHGQLSLVAATSPDIRPAEPLDLVDGSGPAPDCYRSSLPVSCPDLESAPDSWQRFAARARAADVRSVHAWPLRHHDQTIGAAEVYLSQPGQLDEADARRADTLVKVATISVLRERRQQQADILAHQLQRALDSRLVIEQAKGILSVRRNLGLEEAFTVLRGHARRHQMRLATLAKQVIDGSIDLAPAAEGRAAPRPRLRPQPNAAAARPDTSRLS